MPQGPLSFHGCSVSLACPSLPPFSSACPSHIHVFHGTCCSMHPPSTLSNQKAKSPSFPGASKVPVPSLRAVLSAAFAAELSAAFVPPGLPQGSQVQAAVQALRDAGRGLDQQSESGGPRKRPAASSFPGRRRRAQLFAQLVDHFRAARSSDPLSIKGVRRLLDGPSSACGASASNFESSIWSGGGGMNAATSVWEPWFMGLPSPASSPYWKTRSECHLPR